MFEIIPSGTKIPFMKFKWPMIIFSVAITLWSYFLILNKGFHYGVDFAGGVELVVQLPKTVQPDAEKIRNSMRRMGILDASVQEFGSQFDKKEAEYIIHFGADFSEEAKVTMMLNEAFKSLALPGETLISKFRFAGLEKAYLILTKPVPFAELQKAIRSVSFGLLELSDFQVYGRDSSNEYQLTFKSISEMIHKKLSEDFVSTSGEPVVIQKVDFVGAKVGSDLKLSALLSLLITTLLIFVYIFLRFDLVYAPGVVFSLVHDVSITVGIFSLLQIEFDLTIVAALLTLAGYSINDTIIIYDRIREVASSYKGKSFEEIINISINQTLSRTMITSGTVFLTAFALWVWGGPVIHGFALALLVGVIVGTYSSIFIAAPAILFTNWFKDRDSRVKKAA